MEKSTREILSSFALWLLSRDIIETSDISTIQDEIERLSKPKRARLPRNVNKQLLEEEQEELIE